MNKSFALVFLVTCLNLTAIAGDKIKGAALYKACIECHGADGMGKKLKEAPSLKGQYDWYILTQLKAFKSKERKNPKMDPFIKALSYEDFADLAAYISTME